MASRRQSLNKAGEIANNEPWMRLSGRHKRLFHAKVHFQRAPFEPAATSRCQVRWLWLFRNPQQNRIKLARRWLATGRHGQLDMVKRYYRHLVGSLSLIRSLKFDFRFANTGQRLIPA
jgi:hypothetical protein